MTDAATAIQQCQASLQRWQYAGHTVLGVATEPRKQREEILL
jgi:hypothetical protein